MALMLATYSHIGILIDLCKLIFVFQFLQTKLKFAIRNYTITIKTSPTACSYPCTRLSLRIMGQLRVSLQPHVAAFTDAYRMKNYVMMAG